ncbi:MAG: hypothetical protein ACYCT6_09035 [bacterium]
MLKSKKFLSVFFVMAGLLFFFAGPQKASAQNNIFLSTLSNIPGYKIVKDYGFFKFGHHSGNKVIIVSIVGQSPIINWMPNSSPNLAVATFTNINQYKPSGANGCINLKFSNGIYSTCEYVRLVSTK